MNFQVILVIAKWLLGHPAEYQRLIDVFENVSEATTLPAKARASAEAFRIVADLLTDFPDFDTFGADEAAMQAEADMKGISWKKLYDLALKILPIVLLFLDEQQKPETT